MTEQTKPGIDVVADRRSYMSTTKDRHDRLVIALSSITHQLFLSRIKQLSQACAILKKAVQIKAKKTYRIVCDRSEAEVLSSAAKKYCPEAVSEIDAVIKLAVIVNSLTQSSADRKFKNAISAVNMTEEEPPKPPPNEDEPNPPIKEPPTQEPPVKEPPSKDS